MTVRELNREQLDELKVNYVFDQFAKNDDYPAYSDILYAPKIADETIFKAYNDIEFVEDDFFCGKGE